MMHEIGKNIPILMTCFFKSIFLNCLLKFDAMCRMQYTDETSSPFHPMHSDCKAASKPIPLSDIIHKFGYGVTYLSK